MKQVELHFTVKGKYVVPLDESTERAYGTLDPKEMAEVDQDELKRDPLLFMESAITFTVVPGKVREVDS